MCDQTEVSYLENDVVWVKIGPIWWPGVVKDLEKDEEGREILSGLKKKPIAAVKFFQEDNYEFVKNLDQIYHYNCRRKDEFIKKGLDKFRTGASHMKKFPADVTTAESLVQGDVNIINDPKFYPEKKQNYSEIFGSGKKKAKKETEHQPKAKVHTPSSPYRPITHQRFINKALHGESDHKTKTLIQPAMSPEDSAARGIYKCHVCKFETSRVNVIVAHHRLSHSTKNSINWTGSDTKTVKRKPLYKSRKSKVKKLVETTKPDSSDDESLDKKKMKIANEKFVSLNKTKGKNSLPLKSASLTPRKRRTSNESFEDKKKRPRFTDVLLADWSEDDEDEKKLNESEIVKECDQEGEDLENLSSSDELKKEGSTEGDSGKDVAKEDVKNQQEKMSCFDFDEEEEGFIGMSNANTYGRKIPRVIPVKDKSELGVDLEISELFKRKSESEPDDCSAESKESNCNEKELELDNKNKDTEEKVEKNSEKDKDSDKEGKEEKVVKRRRKSSKDQEVKVDENSLAVRRTRRPGAKKSYLNEVIEKIEDVDNTRDKSEEQKQTESKKSNEVQKSSARKSGKDDHPTSSSSRRKQDLKHQTLDNNLEETVYTEILNNEHKSRGSDSLDTKPKEKSQKLKNIANEDLTQRIDNLLAETSVPEFPNIQSCAESRVEFQSKVTETGKSSNVLNLTFDYLTPEHTDVSSKTKGDVKSITKMFSDSIHTLDNSQDSKDKLSDKNVTESKLLSLPQPESEELKSKTLLSPNLIIGNVKSPSSATQGDHRNLSSVISQESSSDPSESQRLVQDDTESSVTDAQGTKKVDVKSVVGDLRDENEIIVDNTEISNRTKNVKTIKLKADTLPSGILSPSGKLKGQTIIHQKGGTYVILSQPPQLPRQKVTAAKAQPSGKVLILTNQLGEQKIITTSGLQQSKYKIEPQKVIVATSSSANTTTDNIASTSGILSVGKTQPVIKMVPDGKGGVMKQLTVSPKKVIVGGTKVLVSGAGTTLSGQGSTIQKIALTGGNNLTGDYRLIEYYKGSGKTVLIQGNSSPAGVLLKTGSATQRSLVTDNIQVSQNVSQLKKKPKIVMRTAPVQSEYVVHSDISNIDSPTYVMKRKGTDDKFSTQKIIRRPVIGSTKAKASTIGSKTYFLSSEQGSQKAEPLIIKTNHEPATGKIIRLSHKIKEMDVKQKLPQMLIQKTPDAVQLPQGSTYTVTESGEEGMKTDATQVVELSQTQPQQPVIQTQVMAMPGPIGSDGNQTYVLVSVDERGVVQPVDNSLITYETSAPAESVFMNSTPNNNVILINSQTSDNVKPVFSNGSQDILAEALANTNVLEGGMSNEMDSIIPSILLPPSIPSSVVQETSVTLQKPIMTPLEMPTSVAPDTSGLEPPPLPPTPTEEDVLMEDQETEMHVTAALKEENLINVEHAAQEGDKKQECLMEFKNSESEHQMELPDVNESMQLAAPKDNELQNVSVDYCEQTKKEVGRAFNNESLQEEFMVENSQEEQGSSSFQSMPLLNDEPDTSDNAQGSEPIGDQDFETQKSRAKTEDFSALLREQEPPSSTNNEVMSESVFENKGASNDNDTISEEKSAEETSKVVELEKPNEDIKVKDMMESKEMQSMPIISDEGGMNSYAISHIYIDPMNQKRFQEETEVTSTTDEFSNKDNNV